MTRRSFVHRLVFLSAWLLPFGCGPRPERRPAYGVGTAFWIG
jgi:hypothetical protein